MVTWSGHYVRDPFNGKQVMLTQLLRRQSRTWPRILRDFGLVKRPSVIIAVASAILFGVSVVALESLNPQQNPFGGLLDQVTEVVEPPEDSP